MTIITIIALYFLDKN